MARPLQIEGPLVASDWSYLVYEPKQGLVWELFC